MTQDEVINLAAEAGFKWPDICETTIEQRLERFANLIAAAEREKCTGTQEFVTLPREVVEHAMEALEHAEKDCADFQRVNIDQICDAATALRAALDHPQNHVPDAGNMVTAGWKLVPVEPTRDMLTTWIKAPFVSNTTAPDLYRSMLNAAPQPPEHYDQQALDLCMTCGWKALIPGDCCLNCARQKPQVEQPAMTPIAQRKLDSMLASGYKISGYSIYHEQKHQHGFVTGAGLVGWWRPEGVEYPQQLGDGWTEVARLLETVNYMLGITERGTGRKVRADETVEQFVLGYVKSLEQPKRQPLTEKDIQKLIVPGDYLTIAGLTKFARDVEAAHNIK